MTRVDVDGYGFLPDVDGVFETPLGLFEIPLGEVEMSVCVYGLFRLLLGLSLASLSLLFLSILAVFVRVSEFLLARDAGEAPRLPPALSPLPLLT